MGMTATNAPQYEASIRRLFPQGAYWEEQFADTESDTSLFAKAKAESLAQFRNRMDILQAESIVNTTDELIADWERVYLGEVSVGLNLEERQRRLLIKEKLDLKLDIEELRIVTAMFGLNLLDVSCPFRPAFFGFSHFGIDQISGCAGFCVVQITTGKALSDTVVFVSDFEAAVKKKLLANQTAVFRYEGV